MKANSILGCAAVILLLSYAMALGQASFWFRNASAVGKVNAPVFDAEGMPLEGANYLAELWGAATPDSLAPLILFDRGESRLIKPFASRGYVNQPDGGLLVVSTVPPTGWAWLQMRAWDARLGETYEEVAARGLGGYGESPLFYAQGGNPYDLLAPIPAPLVGLQSFNLLPVIPEPCPVLLLLLGLPVLPWRCRRPK